MKVPVFGEGKPSKGFSSLLLKPFRVCDFVYFFFGFGVVIEDLSH